MGICTPVKVNTALIYLIYPPFKHWIVADCLLPLSICFLSLRGSIDGCELSRHMRMCHKVDRLVRRGHQGKEENVRIWSDIPIMRVCILSR